MPHHVLIVTTSTGTAGKDGPETGFDWVSVAAPYWRLHESGARVRFASPAGGKPPGDPATASEPGIERRAEGDRAGSVDMFLGDDAAVQGLARSLSAAEAAEREWDGILLADGLGGLWDLAQSDALTALLAAAWERGAVLAAIGAGTAAVASVRVDGRSITSGRRMTCLPDAAIDALLGPDAAPFYPETRLRAQGAQLWIAERGAAPAILEDGRLITGQDARASAEVALQMLEALDVYAFDAGRSDDDKAATVEAEEEEPAAPGEAGIETAQGEADPGEGTDPANAPGARTP